jgi:hypothetical protein
VTMNEDFPNQGWSLSIYAGDFFFPVRECFLIHHEGHEGTQRFGP